MITVLIVDDQKTVQEILRSYIEEDPYLDFIGSASNGQEALEMVKAYRPNIVLMDIEMPVLDGLTATKIISEKFIDTNVLIISVHNEDSYLSTALQVGAKGYLLKNTPAKELINAINSAYKGYFQLGPGLLEKYLRKVGDSPDSTEEIRQLKTMVMQQSEYLESLSSRRKASPSSRQSSSNGNGKNHRHDNKDYLEQKYASLERQMYILTNRLDKQSKKIAFLQQFCIFILFFCAVLSIALLVFAL